MPSTFDTVTAVAHDVENFTSFEVSVAPLPISYDEAGNRLRSIISSDPPDHSPERRLMLPFFSPKVVERYRESTRELCRRLIGGFIEDGRVDAAGDYARQIPPSTPRCRIRSPSGCRGCWNSASRIPRYGRSIG